MYQGGKSVTLFTPQGKNPLSGVATAGRITRGFDPALKGYAVSSHNSHGRLTLGCAPGRRAKKLGLTQQFVCMQVYLHKGAKFSVELCVLDSSMTSRRLRFSNSFRDVVNSTLHVQLPFNPGRLVPHGEWCTLCFDVVDLVHENFKGNSFRAVDGIVLTGTFKLRQVFTLRAPPFDCFKSVDERVALKNSQAIPKAHNFPIALKERPNTVVVRLENIMDTLEQNEPAQEREKKETNNAGEQGFTVAFGSRVRTPKKKVIHTPGKPTRANKTKLSQQRSVPSRQTGSKGPRSERLTATSPAVPEVDEHEQAEQADPHQDQLLEEVFEDDERFFDDEFKSEGEGEGEGEDGVAISPNQSTSKELDFPFDEGHFDEVEAVISKLEATEESGAEEEANVDGMTEQKDPEDGARVARPESDTNEQSPLPRQSSSPSVLDELATEEYDNQEEARLESSLVSSRSKVSPRRELDEAPLEDIAHAVETKDKEDAAETIPEDDEIQGIEENVDSDSDCDVLKALGEDKTEDDIMRRFNEKRAELEQLEESLAADLALEAAASQATHEDSVATVAVDNSGSVDDEEEDLELIYDPILCCYFCPKTNKYYSMKADSST